MSAHGGDTLSSTPDHRVVDCTACGYAHLDPLPDRAELALMYERSYYEEHNPGWLDKDRAERDFWDLEHADKVDDWERLLGRTGGSLLDVGCSGGLLMEFARARGWHAEGVEPSRLAVDEARGHGLTVHEGLYGDVALEPESFDVVHSKLVMEHLPDPRDFLGWAHRLLKPGGILSAQVPNDFNGAQLAARDALAKPDWWVAPPYHLNYFGFESLERLLGACGFEPAARDTTFPMEWFLLMGVDYIGDDATGRQCHGWRMVLEERLEPLGARRALHAMLAGRGEGREAIVHARKAAR